jgi:hypothetical protein
MDDQAALYECFLKHRQSYQIKLFDKAFIDVHPGALIWDGKGRVKRSAEFLEAVASYSTIGREIKLYEEPEAANARVSGERDTGPPEDGGGTVGVN